MDAAAKQAWIRANTFWCDKVESRLTPQQCAENRRRVQREDVPILSKHCPDCPGVTYQEIQTFEPEETISSQGADPVTKSPEPATRRCTQCKQKLPQSSFRRSRITGNLLKRCLDCEGQHNQT